MRTLADCHLQGMVAASRDRPDLAGEKILSTVTVRRLYRPDSCRNRRDPRCWPALPLQPRPRSWPAGNSGSSPAHRCWPGARRWRPSTASKGLIGKILRRSARGQVDQSQAGTTVALMDEGTAKASILASHARGYMDGRSLAEVFAWLRPNDLIWNYWVNELPAREAPAGVRYPPLERRHHPDARGAAPQLHRDRHGQRADQAGRRQHARFPVDLSKIDVDSYVVAGIDDHIHVAGGPQRRHEAGPAQAGQRGG